MPESVTYGSVGGGGSNPSPYPAVNSRPALPFESRGLRRRARVGGSHGRYHGGAAVAQFWRSAMNTHLRVFAFCITMIVVQPVVSNSAVIHVEEPQPLELTLVPPLVWT